eukprot:2131252-Lingulodinium_polyedra.AAC.1
MYAYRSARCAAWRGIGWHGVEWRGTAWRWTGWTGWTAWRRAASDGCAASLQRARLSVCRARGAELCRPRPGAA